LNTPDYVLVGHAIVLSTNCSQSTDYSLSLSFKTISIQSEMTYFKAMKRVKKLYRQMKSKFKYLAAIAKNKRITVFDAFGQYENERLDKMKEEKPIYYDIKVNKKNKEKYKIGDKKGKYKIVRKGKSLYYRFYSKHSQKIYQPIQKRYMAFCNSKTDIQRYLQQLQIPAGETKDFEFCFNGSQDEINNVLAISFSLVTDVTNDIQYSVIFHCESEQYEEQVEEENPQTNLITTKLKTLQSEATNTVYQKNFSSSAMEYDRQKNMNVCKSKQLCSKVFIKQTDRIFIRIINMGQKTALVDPVLYYIFRNYQNPYQIYNSAYYLVDE